MNKKIQATFFAVLAACLYAMNIPLSKEFLASNGPMMMAGFLYLGAGLGIGGIYLLRGKQEGNLLSREDLPYTLGMICLDILAPILLMMGLTRTKSANAALLNNFEIVATTLIAWVVFKEKISKLLGLAIFFITLSSGLLSFEGQESLEFSWGSLLILLASLSWGFENNCTRQISHKNTLEIVAIKGICSGLGSIFLGIWLAESFPRPDDLGKILILGFLAYGLSIFFYIKAQEEIGAAKTSAWYALAPFVAVALSVVFLKENLTGQFFLALGVMVLGSSLVVLDTLKKAHSHQHQHLVYTYNHGHITRKVISHSHPHHHYGQGHHHQHFHGGRLKKS